MQMRPAQGCRKSVIILTASSPGLVLQTHDMVMIARTAKVSEGSTSEMQGNQDQSLLLTIGDHAAAATACSQLHEQQTQ